MTKEELELLHQTDLELLEEVDRICRANNIPYFLDSGTALGAVRHGGFIPWDEDADVGMLRADYERFLIAASRQLKEGFFLQHIDTEENFCHFHAKLRKKYTLFAEETAISLHYAEAGIAIDIFPFDYLPDNKSEAKKHLEKIRKQRRVYYLCINGYKHEKDKMKRLAKRAGYTLVRLRTDVKTEREKFESLCRKYNDKPTNTLTCHAYQMAARMDLMFPVDVMTPVKDVAFEGRNFQIMNDPDAYLTTMYGNYMKPPAECGVFAATAADKDFTSFLPDKPEEHQGEPKIGKYVVVVGKNYGTTHVNVKSAGEAGYRCGVIKQVKKYNRIKNKTPDITSKYVDKYFIVKTKQDSVVLSTLFSNFCKPGTVSALLPADDYSVSLFDRYADQLMPYFRFPMIDHTPGKLTEFLDKKNQKALAEKCGLNTAKSWTISVSDGVTELPKDMRFPCIIKPKYSAAEGMSKALIGKCSSRQELGEKLFGINEKLKGVPFTLIAEELVSFKNEFTIPGVSLDGEEILIPGFVKKTCTGTGKEMGLTITGIVESSEQYPEITETLKYFIKELGYSGIFDIELFENNGVFYFNELNMRNSAAGYAITASGVNLTAIYLDYILGKDWKKNNMVLTPGKTFVNEKASADSLRFHHLTKKEYDDILKNSDIRSITDNDEGAAKSYNLIRLRAKAKQVLK